MSRPITAALLTKHFGSLLTKSPIYISPAVLKVYQKTRSSLGCTRATPTTLRPSP
ncbi:hypothetical protein MGSAQ_003290 [marine sediment metagenome]|uniref:Uncharacterized protein n=1 Tax=marine sediment metagenome TaxID=412755 RepID=A0A1B6NQC8_9ZZZZ